MFGKKQILVVVLVALLGVGLFVMPKQPASVREKAPAEVHQHDGELSEVEKAAALVQNGSNPMEGIMKLREILENDSTNVEAHLYLGLFSVQSGQLDKARMRFNTVLGLDPGNLDAHWQLGQMDFEATAYEDAAMHFEACANSGLDEFQNAWFFMGRSKELAGDADGALKAYKTFRPMTQDTVILSRLDDFIKTLEKTINQ